MTEAEDGSKEKPRQLETFGEKLDFLKATFIVHTKEIRPSPEIAEPSEEVAQVEFGGDLFTGVLGNEEREKIKSELGVDLKTSPAFSLNSEEKSFRVWNIPNSDPPCCLLLREIDDETDILIYEETLVEIFELDENLTRTQ